MSEPNPALPPGSVPPPAMPVPPGPGPLSPLIEVPATQDTLGFIPKIHAALRSIDPQLAGQSHLLVVAGDVEAIEVETLAAQIWLQAHWTEPGILELCSRSPEPQPGEPAAAPERAVLTGPWNIDEAAAGLLQMPSWAKYVYQLSVPPCRGPLVPPSLLGHDPLVDAYPSGGPEGLELEVLSGLRKISRRLAGAIRLDNGKWIWADPDSAVNLRLLTPILLGPAQCLERLSPLLPGANLMGGVGPQSQGRHSRVPPGQRPLSTPQERREYDRGGLRQAATRAAGITPEQREALHEAAEAFDAQALSENQADPGYLIVAPLGKSSQIHVQVHLETSVPPALGPPPPELWSYEICWVPREVSTASRMNLSRSERLERLRAISTIEILARNLVELTEGTLLDEDEFVVQL